MARGRVMRRLGQKGQRAPLTLLGVPADPFRSPWKWRISGLQATDHETAPQDVDTSRPLTPLFYVSSLHRSPIYR